ncbi:hypothetical protein N3K66_000774 [Trichothecium roseum]|uniref:Uncharacterized protein n=1 Tax=Trichothecium roseum TaxID=47278 RepID=A0ACC0VEI6_9HYPO|nr:hypothetical protein N3K66_000774 [Trichothecium roseum]
MSQDEETSRGAEEGGREGSGAGEGTAADPVLANWRAGRRYWEEAGADENGMLGGVPAWEGFGSISRVDLQGSRTFLARLGIGARKGRKAVRNALEGGAGIGRVTEGLLLGLAENVDIVEPVSKFTDKIRGKPGVGTIHNIGLEEWNPTATAGEGAAAGGAVGTYDLIWTQWCLGHLADGQLVEYLRRCATALVPGSGVAVVKENLNSGGENVFDEEDKSVTRSDEMFLSLFEEAGLRVVRSELQRGLPETPTRRLMPVKMYALKPK